MKRIHISAKAARSISVIAVVRMIGAAVFLCISPLVFAHSGEHREGTKKEFVKQVAAGQIQEDCLLVKSGKTLGYTFRSDQQLQFNLHYHIKSADKTIYEEGPTLAKVQPLVNSYTPSASRLMCLMWENKTTSEVRLEYSHWLSSSAE